MLGNPAPIESTIEAGAERLSMELIGMDPSRLVAAHDELFAQMTALEHPSRDSGLRV